MWLIKFRLRTRAHPLLTAVAILGLFILVLTLPVLLIGPRDLTGGTGTLTFETLIGGIPWQIALTALLLCVVWIVSWWDITLFPSRMQAAARKPLVATIVYPLVGLIIFTMLLFNADTARSPLEILGLVLLLNFFVGLSEELLFRGVLFGGLRQRLRLVTAILVSSVAFGLLHLINAGVGQGVAETLFQMLNATALGILFCALVLQGQSLWPAIILHMIWNSFAMMGIAAAEFMGDVPGTARQDLALSARSLILPGIILFIALAILWQYRSRTGHRFRDVIPVVPKVS